MLCDTFAFHFMMAGGNIPALQKILGHQNIHQMMTYAHFAADYLNNAVRFNPLDRWKTIPSRFYLPRNQRQKVSTFASLGVF
ncbi:hypothetical protein [Aeromonas hydrophila]|uniref:hypothetical protein n=1 Tax=Aeromonas hydrophila TaxID=644 RepID=UPI00397754A8